MVACTNGNIDLMCFFLKCPKLLNFNSSPAPFCLKVKGYEVFIVGCVCACMHVLVSGFHKQAICVLLLVMVQHGSNRQVRADEWEAAANDR